VLNSAAADDAVLCLSELASNAIRHSNSARPGGRFTVRIIPAPGRLRVEVQDQGGPWTPDPDSDGHGGRGLLVVDELTAAWGISGDGIRTRVVWFDIDRPR
jgi:serine/threonine-protein kinase RsbW